MTGSLYLLKTKTANIVIECGLFQGRKIEEEANKDHFPFPINKIDAVILSHADLDHSGHLPKLASEGYTGAIYMTHATCELLEILLSDIDTIIPSINKTITF